MLVFASSGPAVVDLVREIAGRGSRGLVVVVTADEHLGSLRAEFRALDNVMVIPEDPDGILPWRDGFFSLILTRGSVPSQGEIGRVLSPGGRLAVISS